MRRILALVLGVACLFSGQALAGSVPLNNGTWKDTQFNSYFTSNIEGVTSISTPFVGLSFQIDPTSLATYDTSTGKFSGQMKLLGSFNSALGVVTDVYLDFDAPDDLIGLGLTADGFPFGTIPDYFFLPTVEIVGNHLTGKGTTFTTVDPTPYQLDVNLPGTTAVPLPAAFWPGLIALAMLMSIKALRVARSI